MGMAASQARYLALSARKSNVEYEGQQINQSRLALANQSANLFNQMLGMSVPTPPSTSDYTTTQYSFSDGANTETLSNYYQLGNSDSDYNYVVTTYHNESVYTGSRKMLKDPQVQATAANNYSYDPASLNENTTSSISKAWLNADGTYGMEGTDGSTTIFKPVTAEQNDQVKAINTGNGVADTSTTADLSNAATKATYLAVQTTDTETINKIAKLYGVDASTIANGDYYSDGSGFVTSADYTASNAASTITKEQGINAVAPQTYYTDGTTFVTKADLDAAVTTYDNNVANGTKDPNTIGLITPDNAPTYSNYTSVGNCKLTELTTADLADEDVKAEIDQIMKDMGSATGGNQISAENLAACFDTDATGNLVYKGGLYSFDMGGTTYYTTEADLASSAGSSIVSNGIDTQQNKLSYYNAIYQDQKVEDTQKALLETDGTGRFSSIKLEDDSVTYTLNTETVTDEDSYNNAMNEYYYEKAQYEKQVSDINSKTEIIQSQDRTLELRLEQLGTEQSALQNEMEAVKKVVDKHAEQGFKTFGG